jgi:hypothetical protein
LSIYEDAFEYAHRSGAISILDTCAGDGSFALRAKERYPDARIIAIEPDPASFAALMRTIQKHALADVISVQAKVVVKRGSGNGVPRISLADALDKLGGRCDLLRIVGTDLIETLAHGTAEHVGAILCETDGGDPSQALRRLGFKVVATGPITGGKITFAVRHLILC